MKNINIKAGLLALALLFSTTACEDFLDVNEDPNNPSTATESQVLPAGIGSAAYVIGGQYQILGGLWSQHITQSMGASQYKGIDSYDINSSTLDTRQFGELYTGCLNDLKNVKEQAEANENWNYYLMATVIQAYTYQVLVDLYDKVPFTEALQGAVNTTPEWDDGEVVYQGIISMINEALAKDLNISTSETPGEDDIIFQGNMDDWVKFANTLKLKIFMRQTYANPTLAQDSITALFTDPDVEFLDKDATMTQFTDSENRRNPLYETEVGFMGFANIVASKTLMSFLQDASSASPQLDPRINAIFNLPLDEGETQHNALAQGNYNDVTQYGSGATRELFSQPTYGPTDPVYFISLSESKFLQAEAMIRYNIGGGYTAAKTAYEQGIEASFTKFGVSGADALYGVGGRYECPAESADLEEHIEAIIVQKWVAMANSQGLEAFFEHNRTHYPKESAVPADDANYVAGQFTVSVNNVTSGKFPKRLIYPNSEQGRNPNTPAPVPVTTKIWWDKK